MSEVGKVKQMSGHCVHMVRRRWQVTVEEPALWDFNLVRLS